MQKNRNDQRKDNYTFVLLSTTLLSISSVQCCILDQACSSHPNESAMLTIKSDSREKNLYPPSGTTTDEHSVKFHRLNFSASISKRTSKRCSPLLIASTPHETKEYLKLVASAYGCLLHWFIIQIHQRIVT